MGAFLEEAKIATHSTKICSIVEGLKKSIINLQKKDTSYHFLEEPPKPKIPKPISREEGLHLFDMDELEVARQLTLPIFEDFSKIKTTELFGQPWAKSSLHHLCPNVLNMIDKFNRISRWIPTTVLREQNPKNRVKMLNKHVLIAQHLKDLANYHILQA